MLWDHLAGVLRSAHEAAETHHRVRRITDEADGGWAPWHANWLVTLSELPELVGGTVVRPEGVPKVTSGIRTLPDASWRGLAKLVR